MLRTLWGLLTGEPREWRHQRHTHSDSLSLLQDPRLGETWEAAVRQRVADVFGGDSRYGALEALEQKIELEGDQTGQHSIHGSESNSDDTLVMPRISSARTPVAAAN